MHDETDSVIDEHRERIALEKEHLAEFARPEFEGPRNQICEICLIECDGDVCVRCESYGGLYGDWRSDSDG